MWTEFFLFLFFFSLLLFLFFFLLRVCSGVVFDLLFWLDFLVWVCVCVCFDVGFWGVSRSLPPALSRVVLNSPLAMLTHVPAAPQPRATAPPCCLRSSRRCGGSGRLRAGPGHEGTASGLRRCPGGLHGAAGRREGGTGGQRGAVAEAATLPFIANLEMIFCYYYCFIFSKSLSLPSGNFSFGFLLISEALQRELRCRYPLCKGCSGSFSSLTRSSLTLQT